MTSFAGARTVRRLSRVLFDELRVERGTDLGSEPDSPDRVSWRLPGYNAARRAAAWTNTNFGAGCFTQMWRCRSEGSRRRGRPPIGSCRLWPADFDLLGAFALWPISRSSSPTGPMTRGFGNASSRSCRASRRFVHQPSFTRLAADADPAGDLSSVSLLRAPRPRRNWRRRRAIPG